MEATFSAGRKSAGVRLLAVLMTVALIMGMLSGCGSGGEYTEKTHKKLLKYLQESDYEKANKLMEKNGYQITDAQQALEVMDTIVDGQTKTFDLSIYYFLPVVDSITCTDSKVIARKDTALYDGGILWFLSDFTLDRVGEMWSRCSEGSKGYDYYEGFREILQGDPVKGAKILETYLDQTENQKETIQSKYRKYLSEKEYADVQEYMNDMLAVGIIFGDDHAASMDAFTLPGDGLIPHSRLHETNYGDIYAYGMILENGALRQTLPEALKNAAGSKILVVDRVLIAGTGESKLGINSFMMKRLPEQYQPETLDEVGYVLLLDYGLEKEGIWYAGTATVTLYDVKSGQAIYTSETLTGQYDQFYSGKATNVIFGSYPDITQIIKEAISKI